jgi:hypothetical protein
MTQQWDFNAMQTRVAQIQQMRETDDIERLQREYAEHVNDMIGQFHAVMKPLWAQYQILKPNGDVPSNLEELKLQPYEVAFSIEGCPYTVYYTDFDRADFVRTAYLTAPNPAYNRDCNIGKTMDDIDWQPPTFLSDEFNILSTTTSDMFVIKFVKAAEQLDRILANMTEVQA